MADIIAQGLAARALGSTAVQGVAFNAQIKSRMDAFFAHSPNLAVSFANGYVNATSGAFTSDPAYFTASAPVSPGKVYAANFNCATGAGAGYVWRDTSGVAIPGAAGYTAFSQITAPANAATLDMPFLVNGTDAIYGVNGVTRFTLMIWEGTAAPTAYLAAGYADAAQVAKEARECASAAGPNKALLMDRTAIAASTLLAQNGTTSVNTAYNMTGFVQVPLSGRIFANQNFVPGNASYGWNWYDRDGNRIGASAGSVNVTTVSGSASLTVPAYSLLIVGLPITGTGIPAGNYIASMSGTTAVMANAYGTSPNATASGAITASVGGFLVNVGIVPPSAAHFGRVSYALGQAGADNFSLSSAAFGSIAATGNAGVPYTADCAGLMGWTDLANKLPWLGKNIALLGDSIMQDATGNNAAQIGITRLLRASGTIWGGVSGRKFREVLNGSPANVSGGRGPTSAYVSTDFASVDLVFINAVTNDFGIWNGTAWGTPRALGAIGDTGASGTFYGDIYDICIAKLQTWNPNMRIVMATPLPRFDNGATGDPTNTNGVKLSAYADAVRVSGRTYGIPVIDLNATIGLNTANSATFLGDGLHPNSLGYAKRWTPNVTGGLNAIY